MMNGMQFALGYQYHKSQLSGKEKRAYSDILNGLFACREKIPLHGYHGLDIFKLLDAVRADNPSLYYVSQYAFSRSMLGDTIIPKYIYNGSSLNSFIRTANAEAAALAASIRKNSGGTKVLMNLHEYILNNITYNEMAANAHNALGPLREKAGVCDGIAGFVKLMCDYLCIQCVIISGKAYSQASRLAGPHSWNAVNISNDWYLFDYTFDNTITHSISGISMPRYDYFSITEKEMERDHYDADICFHSSPKRRDYFTVNNLLVSNRTELEVLVRTHFHKKEIAFKVSDQWRDFNCEGEVHIVMEKNLRPGSGSQRYQYVYNEKQRVCYIALL